MREIKFRGKPRMNYEDLNDIGIPNKNGWVIGSLAGDAIVGEIVELDEDYVNFEWWAAVHQNTIGQYTGLKDKNGTEIYEGDIVKTYNGDKGIVKSGEYQDEEILDYGEEYYIDCEGEERKTVGFFVEHLNGECAALDNRTDKWIEVIGDIYEHPELLEVKQ